MTVTSKWAGSGAVAANCPPAPTASGQLAPARTRLASTSLIEVFSVSLSSLLSECYSFFLNCKTTKLASLRGSFWGRSLWTLRRDDNKNEIQIQFAENAKNIQVSLNELTKRIALSIILNNTIYILHVIFNAWHAYHPTLQNSLFNLRRYYLLTSKIKN